MDVNFDNLRRNIATGYNRLVEDLNSGYSVENAMHNMQNYIAGLLSIYDPDNPDDCNDLSDEIELLEYEYE